MLRAGVQVMKVLHEWMGSLAGGTDHVQQPSDRPLKLLNGNCVRGLDP